MYVCHVVICSERHHSLQMTTWRYLKRAQQHQPIVAHRLVITSSVTRNVDAILNVMVAHRPVI